MRWRRRRSRVQPTGTYTQWQWPSAADGYRSFAWDLTPQTDPSPDGYFWSHQFWLVGGEGGYLGLQTCGAAPTGKIAIFSIWDAVAADSPTFAAPFSGEGSGYTVRCSYQWEVGRAYRLSVAGAGDAAWEARVLGPGEGPEELIGRIQVPPSWGGLRDESVMWTERYWGPLSSCSDMRYSSALFSVPEAGPGGVTPVGHRNYLSDPPVCPGSSVTDVPGGVVQVMGEAGRPPGA